MKKNDPMSDPMGFNPLKFLELTLWVLMTILILKGNWKGDFWEHAACITAFANDGWSSHPMLAIDTISTFYNPYTYFYGSIAKFTGIHAVYLLSIAAFINFFLLIRYLKKFIFTFFNDENVVFYSLYGIFFLWLIPYYYSSFLSINCLKDNLPYPSTMAIAITFFLWYRLIKEENFNIFFILINIALLSLIIISHPLTGIVACIGLGIFFLDKNGFTINKQMISFSLMLILSFLLVLLWPYYSLPELVKSNSEIFHNANRSMYEYPFIRSFPAVLGLISIYYYRKKFKTRALIYLLLSLLLVFTISYFVGKYAYGRSITFIAIILFIYLAYGLDNLESLYVKSKTGKILLKSVLVIFAIFCFFRFNLVQQILPLNQWQISMSEHENVIKHLNQNDVVFSDKNSSWKLPAFGIKVMVCKHPQAFIEDYQQRKDDSNTFFYENYNIQRNNKLLLKYKTGKILFNKKENYDPSVASYLKATKENLFEDEHFIIYRSN